MNTIVAYLELIVNTQNINCDKLRNPREENPMNAAIPEQGKILTAEEIKLSQEKHTTVFSQSQTNYTTLSPDMPQSACANCVFYRPNGYDGLDWNHCHLVEDWPLPIEPTGLCDEWRLNPSETEPDYVPDPVAVYIVEDPADYDTEEMSLSIPKSMIGKVREFIGNLGKPKEPQAFAVFKTADGKMAWVARHTGKWIDREKEILAERAHDAYVARVQAGKVSPPELWMWHAEGTKHGQAVTVWKSGGFVLAAGFFDDTEAGKSAFKYYQKNAGKIKLSHMFHYPSVAKIDGVYHEYNTIEITTLPDGAEAFPYTTFEEIPTMALPDIAKDMIREALGEDTLQRALAADSKAVEDTKALDAMGVASKNYQSYDGSEIVSAAAKVQSVAQAQADMETRLKAAETKLTEATDALASLKSLEETVKTLSTELSEAKTREAAAQTTIIDMQAKLALFTDLKPPASQSSETLLSDREKTLVDSMISAAKTADSPSLVDMAIGGAPTISS
jgi:hypothetical protein